MRGVLDGPSDAPRGTIHILKVDSATLAHLLRTDLVPEAWVGPIEVRELRKDVRFRRSLGEFSTSLKNQVYAELIRKGITYDQGVLGSRRGRAWVRTQLPNNPRVTSRLALLERIEEEIGTVKDELLGPKFAENPQAQLLTTIPGVGEYSALTIAAMIGDIRRFRDSDALVSYAGLAPWVRQSATVLRLGSITKAGPRELRWILVEAMHSHRRFCRAKDECALCKFQVRVSRRRGKQKASVVGAAKLLRIIYWMLTMNQPYRPQGLDPGGTRAGEPRLCE